MKAQVVYFTTRRSILFIYLRTRRSSPTVFNVVSDETESQENIKKKK